MECDPKKIRKLSKSRKRYFDLAKRAAMESTYGKLRHGAVVVKGGSIISFGFNKANHCQFGKRFRHRNKGDATQHAEISAILGMPQGADLYVIRINNFCQWRMSKPCNMCEETLKFVGVRRVFYTLDGKHYDCYRI
mgnify:CR=1 FL=1